MLPRRGAMAGGQWQPLQRKVDEEEPTGSDDTVSDEQIWTGVKPCCLLCLCCMLLTTLVLAGLAVLVQKRGSELSDLLKPTWEVRQLTIENIHLPGIKGVVPADTSLCPGEDPCGVLHAKGCSRCPSEQFWNDGCLCRQNAKGGSAPAGQVIEADTSACPSSDPCGTAPSSGACGRCPDASWISEGCSCRQPPMSVDDFFKGVNEFFGALTGATKAFVKMDVQAVVEVNNPASVGAVAEAATFTISYKGAPIGTSRTPETEIAAAGTASLVAQAHISLDMTSQTGGQLIQEVLNENQLAVEVYGKAISRSGPFVVECTISCHVVMTDVLSAQTTKFPEKDCTYGYKLLPQLAH